MKINTQPFLEKSAVRKKGTIKTVLVAIAMLGAFFAYAEQAKAQNPVVDLGAKGAAAAGEGINAIIQTCINTIGASGGLLGAIISVVLSMLNGLISLVMSALAAVGLGGVAGFCSGAIMGCISGVIGIIAPVIVEILDVLQATGRGIDALCTGVGGLIIVLIADIILTIWQMIGMIVMEILFGIKLLLGVTLGTIAACFGLIPVLAVATSAVGWFVYNAWFIVFLIAWLLGVCFPSSISNTLSGAVTAWSNVGWYSVDTHKLDLIINLATFLVYFVSSIAGGNVALCSTSWCGGINMCIMWIGDHIIMTIIELIVTPIIAIVSLILFVLRLYNILPMIYRFCLDTVCT